MVESVTLPEHLPAPNAEVEVASFPGAFVAFDVRNHMAHELLGTPAVVFDACCERLATAELVAELVEADVGDEDEMRRLVADVLADLAGLGLLEGCAAPVPPPCIECGAGEPRRRARWWRR